MNRGAQGRRVLQRVRGEPFECFIPAPLPPTPPLAFDTAMQDLLERANRGLGRLDGLSTLLPDRALFLYFYVRKEAVLSSQIEGTQSSVSDLLLYESGEGDAVPFDDVSEVSSYVAALNLGLERLRSGFPLSLRLIREIHSVLLSTGRGSERTPGEFRNSQNWIGGSRPGNALFVPPPVEEVIPCLGALENFLHDKPSRTPTLIKAAMAHVQFETIHPFLDGNGRLGRLLITFLLCAEEAISEPLLYLSLYLKANRARYYELLQRVRMEGDWEEWLRFFLQGVIETSEQATDTARRILALFDADRETLTALGRTGHSALRILEFMRRNPLLSATKAASGVGLSMPVTNQALERLQESGIVREVTGRKRGRLFAYRAYLDILNEGGQPLPV
jgi:Fic family protein